MAHSNPNPGATKHTRKQLGDEVGIVLFTIKVLSSFSSLSLNHHHHAMDMKSHLYPPSVPYNRPLAPRHGRHQRDVEHPVHDGRDDVYDDSQHRLHSYIERLQEEGKERDCHINRLLHELHENREWMSQQIENISNEQEHAAKRNQRTQEHLTIVKKNCAELTDNLEQNCRDLWEENTRLEKSLASTQGQ